MRQRRLPHRHMPYGFVSLVAMAVSLGLSSPAAAVRLSTSPDWQARWDNTLQYNLGMRIQDMDSKIGNSPTGNQGDYKFSDSGDIVTNRISVLSELDLVYQRRYGIRLSGSGWKDFAYDDVAETNPGELAPGTPYPNNYDEAKYSHYTKKYYIAGAELLDAFAFANFSVNGMPVSVKAGRFTQYWGNSVFFASHGIAYSQSATDKIKGAASPGTSVKELSLPHAQTSLGLQLTPELSINFQYSLEFQGGDRLPEGGTYLGPVDFIAKGPDRFALAGLPRGPEDEPDGAGDNYGVNLRWTPPSGTSTIGVYARSFTESSGWLLTNTTAADAPYYSFAYPRDTEMLGASLDTNVGSASVGLEVSYRHNSGLNSVGLAASEEGARGDLLNLDANLLIGLTPNSIWDTGVVIAELAYQRKLSVDENKNLYNEIGSANCGTDSHYTGCATDDQVAAAIQFAPQWLSVMPSVDMDIPLFAIYGVYGNAPGLGSPVAQGDLQYSLGVHFLYRQRYNLTLSYNGYYGRHKGVTNAGAASDVPNGTPGFPSYYAAGNSLYGLGDRGWLSLVLSTTF